MVPLTSLSALSSFPYRLISRTNGSTGEKCANQFSVSILEAVTFSEWLRSPSWITNVFVSRSQNDNISVVF